MNLTLRHDADAIVRASIQAVLPDEAIRRALAEFRPGPGRTLLAYFNMLQRDFRRLLGVWEGADLMPLGLSLIHISEPTRPG